MAALVLLGLVVSVVLALWAGRRRPPDVPREELPFVHRQWPDEEISRSKPEPPVPQMPQPSSALPERDNWETGYLLKEDRQLAIEMPAWIHYRDATGQESRRDIVVRRLVVLQEGGEAVLAFCEARKASRTFVLSRMLQFVDKRTGEVVSDVSAHLWASHRESPVGRVEQAFSVRAAEVNVLVFIARADGAMRQKQRDLIAAYLLTAEPSLIGCNAELASAIAAPRPNQTDYRKHIRDAKAKPEADQVALLAAAEGLAATRTTQREFTESALQVARKAFGPPQAPKPKRIHSQAEKRSE